MVEADIWRQDVDIAREALRERFPDLTCLRCGADRFSFRVWRDENLVPGLADETNNRVVEVICDNCGFQERHVVNLLVTDKAG